jgi:hypothetical protein
MVERVQARLKVFGWNAETGGCQRAQALQTMTTRG